MKSLKTLITGIIFIMPLFSSAKSELEIGDTAPALIVTTQTGESLNLGDIYASGPVAVYFYPKSDTPGCTKQACNIRDNFAVLQEAGVTVIGVSPDSIDKQLDFVEKYALPFDIVADTERELGKAFGVGSYGGFGFKRQSFLIVNGEVAWRDLKANPTTQSEDILAALKELEKEG